MLKKVSSIPFHGTAEQEAQLKAVIEENKHDKSMLMHVMQQAQQIYGYLPFEVQVMIADGMNLPLEKVYGVATFYAQFALSQRAPTTSRFALAPPVMSRARRKCSTRYAKCCNAAPKSARRTAAFL